MIPPFFCSPRIGVAEGVLVGVCLGVALGVSVGVHVGVGAGIRLDQPFRAGVAAGRGRGLRSWAVCSALRVGVDDAELFFGGLRDGERQSAGDGRGYKTSVLLSKSRYNEYNYIRIDQFCLHSTGCPINGPTIYKQKDTRCTLR